ncbi:MAG: PG0541 family transporter-associated protein [bacterium]
MLKMVMIVYNEALDLEVTESLEGIAKNYTKITAAYGRGESSGTHLGNDIWPGRNNILYIACEEKEAQQILGRVKELRKKIGHEGAKAFLLPLEEMT